MIDLASVTASACMNSRSTHPAEPHLIPIPASLETKEGTCAVPQNGHILVAPGTDELLAIGSFLAAKVNGSTGLRLTVRVGASGAAPSSGDVVLTTDGTDPSLGEEGYDLNVNVHGIALTAYQPAGLFRGVQTLRQLFHSYAENDERSPPASRWLLRTTVIRDVPRFSWRGAMLDVSRHFFGVDDVKRYMDLLAAYKLNVFHIHLTDDQGWRIEIKSRPKLTEIGSVSEVGGGNGGYYTQAEFADLVAYARKRYMTLVPEIEMPGHSNAALAAYAELACDGVSPKPYTGTDVGFSSLCVTKEETYAFVGDIVRELSGLVPGGVIHMGGDEADATSDEDYRTFMRRVSAIVKRHGLRMMAWEDIAKADLGAEVIAQTYRKSNQADAGAVAKQGGKLVISTADRAYLDMKYDKTTKLGLTWAGYVEVPTAYNWDPAALIAGLTEDRILGVEGPLWTETIETYNDLTYMAFPRIIGLAEVGWSQARSRDWSSYRHRLAAHGQRLRAMGVNFYPSPMVPW